MYKLRVWDQRGGYAERQVEVSVIGQVITDEIVTAQAHALTSLRSQPDLDPSDAIPHGLLGAISAVVATVAPKQQQQSGLLTAADSAAMTTAADALEVAAARASLATATEREALIATAIAAFEVGPAALDPQLIDAVARAAIAGIPQASLAARAPELQAFVSTGVARGAADYRNESTLWPGPRDPGCALTPARGRSSPPSGVTWGHLMSLLGTSTAWLAAGLLPGERACSDTAAFKACVERASAQATLPHVSDVDGVRLELPTQWYATEGVAEGGAFDTRVVLFKTSPYYWTAALDLPPTSVSVTAPDGRPLLTARDGAHDLYLTLPAGACNATQRRACTYFDPDPAVSAWVTADAGVLPVSETNTSLTCRSNHLTDFLVYSDGDAQSPLPPPAVNPFKVRPRSSLGDLHGTCSTRIAGMHRRAEDVYDPPPPTPVNPPFRWGDRAMGFFRRVAPTVARYNLRLFLPKERGLSVVVGWGVTGLQGRGTRRW